MVPDRLLRAREGGDSDRLLVRPDKKLMPGAVIEARYRVCAGKYQQIVACTGTIAMSGEDMTPRIRLRDDGTLAQRLAAMSVFLRFSEYAPNRSSFQAILAFRSHGPNKESLSSTEELFGGPGIVVSTSYPVPMFAFDPNTDEVFKWNASAYNRYAASVLSMVDEAEHSQPWIIDSLRDRSLNPEFASTAIAMFG